MLQLESVQSDTTAPTGPLLFTSCYIFFLLSRYHHPPASGCGLAATLLHVIAMWGAAAALPLTEAASPTLVVEAGHCGSDSATDSHTLPLPPLLAPQASSMRLPPVNAPQGTHPVYPPIVQQPRHDCLHLHRINRLTEHLILQPALILAPLWYHQPCSSSSTY